jgi:hypothetical protein
MLSALQRFRLSTDAVSYLAPLENSDMETTFNRSTLSYEEEASIYNESVQAISMFLPTERTSEAQESEKTAFDSTVTVPVYLFHISGSLKFCRMRIWKEYSQKKKGGMFAHADLSFAIILRY